MQFAHNGYYKGSTPLGLIKGLIKINLASLVNRRLSGKPTTNYHKGSWLT